MPMYYYLNILLINIDIHMIYDSLKLMLGILLSLSCSTLFTPFEEKSFICWMRDNGYFFSREEYCFRLGIYVQNTRTIHEFNKAHDFKLKSNHFTHLTLTEYKALLGFHQESKNIQTQKTKSLKDVPESIDYRENGWVTPVQDQGNCGSCWAFSTTAAMESLYAKTHENQLIKLSEQFLVNCINTCHGCSGCDFYIATQFISTKFNGATAYYDDVPYFGVQMNCVIPQRMIGNLKFSYFSAIRDEEEMRVNVGTYGPVIAGMKASLFSFVYYSSGIYYERGCSEFDFDHGVCVVGYGEENNQKYWIIKNSMSKNWGEEGYMRLARDQGNMCGIASHTVFITDVQPK